MPIQVLFVLSAIIFGAGVMLSPAFPTKQPRIGLAAAFAIALVLGGSVFWAMLFGWRTLVVDYLLFALITAIFLFGTLSYGQKRAEERGEVLLDENQGWPNSRDLLFFALVGAIFVVPALILPVPLDTDGQGFGYLGLLVKQGGDFRSLAPWYPDVSYLYAPSFSLLIAYLSQQLGTGLHAVQICVAAVFAVLNVWLAYDFGAEIRDKRLGWAMALSMLIGTGLLTAYLDSHFTTVMGLAFAQACLIFAYRYLQERHRFDLIASGLMLGTTVLTHPDTTIILGLGLAPWLVSMWWSKQRPLNARVWGTLIVGMLGVALLGLLPWLWNIRDLFGSTVASPFQTATAYLGVMVAYHGGVVVLLALVGAWVGLKGRESAAFLALGWLALVVEFAALGWLGKVIPALESTLLRFDYPFSIAWHGPIIPYSILGGFGLLWLWERFGAGRVGQFVQRRGAWLLVGMLLVVLSTLAWWPSALAFSKGRVGFFGAFASEADVRALTWVKFNTPKDARLLNYVGTRQDNGYEGDWAAVISERDSLSFRWQPFFIVTPEQQAERAALHAHMLAFWQNPADPTNLDFLKAQGVDYIIVPQVVTQPAALDGLFRWRAPDIIAASSRPSAAPFLRQVYADQGAEVYQVIAEAS